MDSALYPRTPLNMSMSGEFSSPRTDRSHPGRAPEDRHTSVYGRFSVERSDTRPIFSVSNFLPGMPQERDLFPSGRFGSGVSSVGNVPRNLSLHNQVAMVPDYPPYPVEAQQLAGVGMASGYCPYGCTATSTSPVNAMVETSQPDSFRKTTHQADTSESKSRQAGPQKKARKKRTNFPPWKVYELNKAFHKSAYIKSYQRAGLALKLQMTEEQIKVWFQNKRMNAKRQAMADLTRNTGQFPEASKKVPESLLSTQQTSTVSGQVSGEQQRYSLLADREDTSAMAESSTVDAVQGMLVKIDDITQERFSCLADGYRHSRGNDSEFPETASARELTKAHDEPDSSNSPGL